MSGWRNPGFGPRCQVIAGSRFWPPTGCDQDMTHWRSDGAAPQSGGCCRGCWGVGLGWVGWYGLFTPPRPPPPVILPGAAFASLCLAGASRRASPFGLALPRMAWGGLLERVLMTPYGGTRFEMSPYRGPRRYGAGRRVGASRRATTSGRALPPASCGRVLLRHLCTTRSMQGALFSAPRMPAPTRSSY